MGYTRILYMRTTIDLCICCLAENVKLSPARCAEKPEHLQGLPIGMYHCPECGVMLIAGLPHPDLCDSCQPNAPHHPLPTPNPL